MDRVITVAAAAAVLLGAVLGLEPKVQVLLAVLASQLAGIVVGTVARRQTKEVTS